MAIEHKPEMPHPELVDEILSFIEEHNMHRSGFGFEAMGDPSFVFDLEGGRECRRATIRRIREYMNAKRVSA